MSRPSSSSSRGSGRGKGGSRGRGRWDGCNFSDRQAAVHRDGPPAASEYTFCLLFSAGLDDEVLRASFTAAGFREFEATTSAESERIGVMMLGGDPDSSTPGHVRRLMGRACVVKNFVDDGRKLISSKWELYRQVRALCEQRRLAGDASLPESVVADTQLLDGSTRVIDGRVYIVKPVGGAAAMGGAGISIVRSNAELQAAYQRLRADRRFRSAVVCDYCPQPPESPLLWRGRKFHLRMFLLVRAASPTAPYLCELWPRGRVVIAGEPYRPDDWNNTAVHDTHSPTTPHNLWFPEDLPDVGQRQLLWRRLQTVAAALGAILQHKVRPYPESQFAFHVFGLDVLVKSNYDVLLMEANDKTGLYSLGDPVDMTDNEVSRSFYVNGSYTFKDFCRDYFDWIYARAIHPFFPNAAPPHLPLKTFGINQQEYIDQQHIDQQIDQQHIDQQIDQQQIDQQQIDQPFDQSISECSSSIDCEGQSPEHKRQRT